MKKLEVKLKSLDSAASLAWAKDRAAVKPNYITVECAKSDFSRDRDFVIFIDDDDRDIAIIAKTDILSIMRKDASPKQSPENN